MIDEEEVLAAALEAFAERGFEGTSVRELARSLQVSHNFIPQRFGSKERLWYAAVDHGFGQLAAQLGTVLHDPPEDDLERLRLMVLRFVEANAARPALLRIINQEAAAPGPRLDHLFERYIRPVGDAGADLLRRLSQAGRVRTDSVALVYFMMTHGAGAPYAFPALAERFGPVVDVTDEASVHRSALAVVDLLFEGLAGAPTE